MDYLFLLSILSNFFTILFFVSPATMITKMIKTGDTSKIPYLLFLFTNINCLFWFIYGVKLNSWAIYSNNFFGIVANTMYLSLFIIYLNNCSNRLKVILIFLTIIFNIVTFSFFITFVKKAQISGSIAMVFNIIMNLSQLQKLKEVFIYKDKNYIPLLTVTCLFLQSAVWTTIGILSNLNMFIIIPNLLGLSLALMQIIIWFYFSQQEEKKRNDLQNEKEKEELKGLILIK